MCFVRSSRSARSQGVSTKALQDRDLGSSARCRELHVDDEAGRAFRLAGAGLSEVFVYDLAERWLRDGISFAEQNELWNHRCYMTAHLGLALWATGRWAEADGWPPRRCARAAAA